MQKSKFYLVLLLNIIFFSSMMAQNAEGMKLLKDERYWSAEKVFAKSKEEADVFYKGFSQMKMDDATSAKATFNSIATTPYGKIGLGWLELNANNVSGAKELFESAAKETKNKDLNIFVAISTAIANSTVEDKSAAIDWADKAVDKHKSNPDYRITWGNAYLSTQDGGSAITQYEYAQQFDNTSAYPDAKIGQVYFRSKNYSLAKEYLYKALAKDSKSLLSMNYLAQIYYQYRDFDSAKYFQSQILELGDKSPEDMAMMANIYFLGKDYNQAITLINDIIKGDNKYNYLNRLIGYSYYETKKPAEAVSYLSKFVETQPKEKLLASDYEYLGKAMLETGGDTLTALNTIKKAVEMKPNDRETLTSVAEALMSFKMYADAATYYEKIAKLEDANTNDLFQLGKIYHYYLKEYPKAIASYTRAIELGGSGGVFHYLIADVKLRADPEQTTASAKEDYLKFVEMSSDNVEKYKKQIITSKIYLAKDAIKNMEDKALGKEYINSVLELDPGNAEATDLIQYTE